MNAPRTPTELASPRMDALSRLPVFFALEGKRVLVAGGSAAAAWKAELLSAAGAIVEVFAENPGEEMIALAAQPPRGPIHLHASAWGESDLAGMAMAVAACADDAEAERFGFAARAAGVPVNVIDNPAFCDFSFGAIVNRSPMVVAISTDGASPVFAQAVRAKLEAMLPKGFAAWADAARRWRRLLKGTGLSFAGRRRFWQLFTAHAVRHPDVAPTDADFNAFADMALAEGEAVDGGSVTLVGAGPGDPELLTLRAVRALQSADLILFDDLVSPEVLDFARREAKKMLVGKTGGGPSCKQADINALMVGLAKAGRRVVRLKGGDPMIFGRAGEEIAACRAAGIPVEIVAGVTAAQGAASRLGISLTHRDEARRVQFVTGHAKDGRLPDDIDWRSLADPAMTTVLYMPKRTLGDFAKLAMENGLATQTPAVAIAGATRPQEIIIAGTIANLAEKVAAQAPTGPMLVMIGRVFAQQSNVAATAVRQSVN